MTKDTNNKNTYLIIIKKLYLMKLIPLKKVDTLTIHQKNNYISNDEIITNYSFKKEPS